MTFEQMTLEQMIAQAPGFTSDSRAVRVGDVFVALKGEKFDAAQAVPEVLTKAPSGVVVARGFGARFPQVQDGRVVEVDDLSEAHRTIAQGLRAKFKGRVVAVGGSNGKTTTKDFLAQLLSTHFRTMKTEKSQNGVLGIPKTLERLRPEVEIAVVEVGIDGPGEMIRHVRTVSPEIAVLTSIGEEHLNLLKTVDNVFTEERILIDETLKAGGRAFVPGLDPYLARIAGAERSPAHPREVDATFAVHLSHPKAVQNAALAALVAWRLGVPREKIAAELLKLEVPDGRGREIEISDGRVLVLDDRYNANVASMKVAIEHAVETARRLKRPLRIAVGDMFDLGEATVSAHRQVAEFLANAQPETLVLIGPQMSALRDDLNERLQTKIETFPDAVAARDCADRLRADSAVVLLKASRGMALENLLSALTA